MNDHYKAGDRLDVYCVSCAGTGEGGDRHSPRSKCRWCFGAGHHETQLNPMEAAIANAARAELEAEINEAADKTALDDGRVPPITTIDGLWWVGRWTDGGDAIKYKTFIETLRAATNPEGDA